LFSDLHYLRQFIQSELHSLLHNCNNTWKCHGATSMTYFQSDRPGLENINNMACPNYLQQLRAATGSWNSKYKSGWLSELAKVLHQYLQIMESEKHSSNWIVKTEVSILQCY